MGTTTTIKTRTALPETDGRICKWCTAVLQDFSLSHGSIHQKRLLSRVRYPSRSPPGVEHPSTSLGERHW
eukprot:scaffold509312_cov45-Prasinocladus_malaysianus.AAC.1